MMTSEKSTPGVPKGRTPRILLANPQQQRRLAVAAAAVHAGASQSMIVDNALDELLLVKRQFGAEPHYLLAAAAHLLDEGFLDEDYELADKLGIATGDAALVLRRTAATDHPKDVNQETLVREFYPGAEADPHTRSLLMNALEVMQAAVVELRNEDELLVLAR